jgi:class 3 adenylate cyclase
MWTTVSAESTIFVAFIICPQLFVCLHSAYDRFSYELTGNRAIYLGNGDQHETAFNKYEVVIPFDAYRDPDLAAITEKHCRYSLHMYPSQQFAQGYESNLPIVFTSLVAATFFLMALTFLVYDRFVYRRNIKVVDAAARSNAIVSSLFPSNVRERLFEDAKAKSDVNQAAHSRLKTFLHGGDIPETAISDANEINGNFFKSKPIAELFPQTTIMFGDISGFTAWSSSREPAQVFQLLETLYHSFDEIAKKRRVFKVETVGDCYVAVAGLPDPRKDHAVVMARFAKDCMHRMHSMTRKLEVSLGPDTTDLSLRIGLHSGPVTAGVLRGERSRFQLFGDTMNTAARMESNGIRGRIQISQETADLIVAAGKAHWFVAREDTIVAKGKGELKTFWLALGDGGKTKSTTDTTHSSDDVSSPNHNSSMILDGLMVTSAESDQQVNTLMSNKTSRLIDWNVDVLSRLIKQIIAQRKASSSPTKDSTKKHFCPGDNRGAATTVLDEVTEILALPEFDAEAARRQQDPQNIELNANITTQLQQYVSNVSAMYQNNPFHNFEHASHVTMSVVKLLSRIVAPVDVVVSDGKNQKRSIASKLHDHTYGITSDPLTQFACVFSALIHDVDHSGVPNVQLVKENSKIAKFYQGRSVAEQNSVDLAWELLLDESFDDLRAAIFATDGEKARFRQLVVNSVMATDIMDPDFKAIRNARWEKAFTKCPNLEEDAKQATNRKATIVIEHMIQASDVAHTMQHWHIYRKWNERLFMEMYQAFKSGRAEKSPETFWYKGELGFFDFYIIPLAMKLKDCGVFGVSSDEYLNYATRNRKEWEDRGQEVVREMMEKIGFGSMDSETMK